MRSATIIALPLALALGLAEPAAAGELLYANGNRLAGDLGPGGLLVSTGSDLVEVPSEQVSALTREEVRLKDGRVVRGTLVGGRLRVQTALGELTVELDELSEFRAEAPPAPAVAVGTPAPAPAAVPPPAAPPAATAARSSTESPEGQAAAAPGGPGQVVDGAKQVGQGVESTAKGVGRTVTDAAVGTAQVTKRAADRVHDGFKAFGEAVWEGMKSAGRAFQSAFTGD
jgi:hypothetical protein